MSYSRVYLLVGLLGFFAASGYGAESSTNVPYFASLRSEVVNVRSGPSIRYPLKWTYKRKNYPVEVVSTFQQWRKLSDIEGESGWVHESLLSRKRFILLQGAEKIMLRKLPNPTALVVAEAENHAMAELLSCKEQWCKVQAGDVKGWVDSRSLWGVYANEVVE